MPTFHAGRASLIALILAAGANAAAAQQAKPPTPQPAQRAAQTAASDTPQSTTASYADWVVQCQTQPGPPPQKVCDMAQVAQVQGKNLPFSRIAVMHPTKGQPVRLVVQSPVNVSFASSMRIQISDSDPGIAAPFARCVPVGCFADFDLKDDLLKKFTGASGTGKLTFVDAGGHDVAVPVSFNGFAQAFDALSKE